MLIDEIDLYLHPAWQRTSCGARGTLSVRLQLVAPDAFDALALVAASVSIRMKASG